MPYAKDGTPHHSLSRASHHDGMQADRKAPPAVHEMKKAAPAADGKDGNDVSHMKIAEVVKKHGPAHDIAMTHDHEAMQHHVHSTHGDKHHHSDHGSAKAAHEHAMMAAGIDHDEEETPDEEAGETGADETAEMAPSTGIPGLSS